MQHTQRYYDQQTTKEMMQECATLESGVCAIETLKSELEFTRRQRDQARSDYEFVTAEAQYTASQLKQAETTIHETELERDQAMEELWSTVAQCDRLSAELQRTRQLLIQKTVNSINRELRGKNKKRKRATELEQLFLPDTNAFPVARRQRRCSVTKVK